MNKFFDTAIGKSVKTLLWTAVSYGLAFGMLTLANFHWSNNAVALGLPGLINLLLYTFKVFADKEVPNLPSSTPMRLVPDPTVVAPTAAR